MNMIETQKIEFYSIFRRNRMSLQRNGRCKEKEIET